MTTEARTQPRIDDRPWLIGLALLVLIGIAAWVIQATQGFTVLGVSQTVVWGAYIGAFFTLASIAGGLVILAALSDLDVVPSLQPYRHSMLLGAIAMFVAAGCMILMDIGQPLRVLNIVFSANVTSPFVWDFASLALSVIVAAIYLYSTAGSRWLPTLAGVLAALVLVVEGLILSMSAAGVLWHGGLMPVIFAVEGLLASAALVLAVQPGREAAHWLQRTVLVALPTVAVLNLLEIAAVSYAGDAGARAAVAVFWSGSLAPLFWSQAVLGIALPFVLLLWGGNSRAVTVTAGVLVILGVFVTKLGILVSGQTLDLMQNETAYVPTLIEAAGVVGAIGLAGLLFMLGRRWVPER